MRILSIIVLVAVSVVSFLPCLWAGDTAGLNLTVTFAVDKPPYWVIEPQDGSIEAGETLTIEVSAEDPEGAHIAYGCRWYLNGVRQPPFTLPEGAVFVSKESIPILPPTTSSATLIWKVPLNINLTDIHEVEFTASDSQPDPDSSGNTISKKIRVTLREGRIISIEINNPAWNLEGVKLGERRNNSDEMGNPMHAIRNTGNVPVMVDIGYPKYSIILPGHPYPGLEQGLDTYITMVGGFVLPPFEKMKLVYALSPDQRTQVSLTFGAPKALSAPIDSFNVGYEIRAYPAIYTEDK